MAISKKKDLGEKLSLFHLTWPIFLEVFLFMLMGIADTFMLSALSDDAVSGVGAANQYIHIAILILEVVGNGAAIVVSQYLGSKRYIEASKISGLAVTLNLGVGIVLSIGFVLFSKSIMSAMNLEGEVLAHAHQYLINCRWSNFPSSCYKCIGCYYPCSWVYKADDVCFLRYEHYSCYRKLLINIWKLWFPAIRCARSSYFISC